MKKIIMLVAALIGLFADSKAQNVTRYPNPDDCETYFECENNVLTVLECPDGLQYNKDIQTCDWPYVVNCEDNGSSTTFPPPNLNCPIFGESAKDICGAKVFNVGSITSFLADTPLDPTVYEVIRYYDVQGYHMVEVKVLITYWTQKWEDKCPGYAGFCSKFDCQ